MEVKETSKKHKIVEVKKETIKAHLGHICFHDSPPHIQLHNFQWICHRFGWHSACCSHIDSSRRRNCHILQSIIHVQQVIVSEVTISVLLKIGFYFFNFYFLSSFLVCILFFPLLLHYTSINTCIIATTATKLRSKTNMHMQLTWATIETHPACITATLPVSMATRLTVWGTDSRAIGTIRSIRTRLKKFKS